MRAGRDVPEVLPPRILSHHQATERERRVRSTFDDLPTLDELQRRYLVFVLESVGGSRMKTAEIMGVDRRTVTRMLDRYSLKPTDTEETD
jgi:DNA-binding NtrC family response regulator